MARLRKEIKETEAQLDSLTRNAPQLNIAREGAWSDLANQSAGASANYTDAPAYMSADQAGKYTTNLMSSLGLGNSPQDIRDTTRKSVMGQLDRSAYETMTADARNMAATGGGSGASAALASRRGMQLAQSKADAEAGIQKDYADRADAYRNMMFQAAMGNAQNQSAYNFGAVDAKNKFDLANTQLQSDAQFRAGQFLGDQDYQRTMSDYEANQLMPWQARLGVLQGKLAGQQNRLANRQAIGSSIANTAMQTVGEVMPG